MDNERRQRTFRRARGTFSDSIYLWEGSKSGYDGADAAAKAEDEPTATVVGNSFIHRIFYLPFERSPKRRTALKTI